MSEIISSRPELLTPIDARVLMSWPFFSLAKSKRLTPIDFSMKDVSILVEAMPAHGMATIWDADVLIWVATWFARAHDNGFAISRRIETTPYDILTFIGRGVGARDYARLKAALDRLQTTSIVTTLNAPSERYRARFSWLNAWKERADHDGRPLGIELSLPEWLHACFADGAQLLAIDRGYFDLTGGLERWLYRLVRRHAGHQPEGWRFDLKHLHAKSGSLSPHKRFAFELRDIVRRQSLPGYELGFEFTADGRTLLAFAPCGKPCARAVDSLVLSGTRTIVLSGTPHFIEDSKQESKPSSGARDVENHAAAPATIRRLAQRGAP